MQRDRAGDDSYMACGIITGCTDLRNGDTCQRDDDMCRI